MPKMTNLCALLLLALVSGCVSVGSPLTSKIDISTLDAAASPLALRDRRVAMVNDPRKPESIMPQEAFTPPLSALLARRLAAEKLALLEGKEVELTVGHTTVEPITPARQSSQTPLPPITSVLPKALPAGVDVLAGLISSKVLSAIESNERLKFETALEVRVDGKAYGVRAFTFNDTGTTEANMRESVSQAIRKLLAELSTATVEPELVQLGGPGMPE